MWEELLLSKAMFRENLLPLPFSFLSSRNGGMEREERGERREKGSRRSERNWRFIAHPTPSSRKPLEKLGRKEGKPGEQKLSFPAEKEKMGKRRSWFRTRILGQGNCNAIYGNVWQELNIARFLLSQARCVHLLCVAYLKLRYNKSHFRHTERALGKQGCLTILLSIKPVSLRISGRNSTEF